MIVYQQSGNIREAREVAIEASHNYAFNDETYVFLLMGLNQSLKKGKGEEGNEVEKAQILSLAMTLLHKYRKVLVILPIHQTTTPTVDFYLQIINLLGYYHEYDRLDQIIQFMNKDKIPFDGKM